MSTEQQLKDLYESTVNLDEAVHDLEVNHKALVVLYNDLKRKYEDLQHVVQILSARE